MICNNCKIEVKLQKKNIVISIGSHGKEKILDIKWKCGECGKIVSTGYLGESEFIRRPL